MKQIKHPLQLTLLISLIILSNEITAQSHRLAVSITGGIVQDGFAGAITTDYKVNEFDYLQFNLQGSFSSFEQNDVDIPVDTYAFTAGFFFDLLRNNSRTFAISTGAGALIGYEIINNNDTSLPNDLLLNLETNKTIYGGYAGLDIDFFISPVITIHLKLNEMYHINSEIGEFTPYVGLGIKLILK
ncbi:conjugal transfer protein TraO [Aquimarina litoralis]|uniref:conjugal transfer protein TraO n=1 Tax=Aquimarina litoralis TaxID=584605 RepID=UPI001C57FC77|nr:conjugal transfer protein TraO [Aquimarina litoralis]MBW1298272.1 hypothetical protein [Aquimarina litoralis]